MSYGSYYGGDYYKNPTPYTSSDIGEPVPGWGVNPAVAGPARVGVGAMKLKKSAIFSPSTQVQQASKAQPDDSSGSSGDSGIPTYTWILIGVFVVGGGVALAKNKNWF